MPHFRPTAPQIETLANFKSSYRFDTLAQSGSIRCTIVDTQTGNGFACGEGVNEDQAFAAALQNANGSDRPTTPADLVAERDELRKRVAELEAAGTTTTPAPRGTR